jgi:hypothetical protein
MTINNNEKIQTLIQSCQKNTPPTSAHGMRTMKSISGNSNFSIFMK